MKNTTRLITLFTSFSVLMVTPAAAQTAVDPSDIEVTGFGDVLREPDAAVVTIGAVRRADTSVEAQSQVNQAINATLESVRDLDVEGLEIRTTGITLRPEYEEIKDGERTRRGDLTGYRAERDVRIRMTDLTAVGAVIDQAIRNGVNELRGADFIIEDSTAEELEALRLATLDAEQRAEAIADALGMQLGPVLEVDNVGGGVGYGGVSPFSDAEAVVTEIDPSPINVDGSVRIRWQLVEKQGG